MQQLPNMIHEVLTLTSGVFGCENPVLHLDIGLQGDGNQVRVNILPGGDVDQGVIFVDGLVKDVDVVTAASIPD